MFWSIIEILASISIGLLINHLIIEPLEQKKARNWCIQHGLVPEEDNDSKP